MSSGNYTHGCIGDSRQLLNQESIDAAYRLDDGYLTRSYAHSVHKYGGVGQELLDKGESLFSGNSGTSFGTIVDRLIPALICGKTIDDLYVYAPDEVLSNGARRGKEYAAWKADLGNKRDLSRDDFFRARAIAENTLRHPRCSEILSQTLDCQGALRWTDEDGHKRKALLDGLCSFPWDFKTTSSDWKSLWRSCDEFGYLWQAAWYQDGCIACEISDEPLRFIFAQTFKPYAVRVRTLPPDLVDQAREEIRETLSQIALRREIGVYSSPEDDEEGELEFPAFLRRGARNEY
jgi:hypothetical protein